jgi:hypothetical protein
MDEAKQAHMDDQFLHTAANILRRDIHNLDIKNDFYPAPSECSFSNSIKRFKLTISIDGITYRNRTAEHNIGSTMAM